MLYQELVIDGLCECCQKIDIDHPSNSEAGSDESLVVTIYYSARSKTDVVVAARALAKAAGLSDDHVRTVGREPDESFQWQGASQGEMFVMAVKLTHREAHWTVFVHADRHLLPVPAAKLGDGSH